MGWRVSLRAAAARTSSSRAALLALTQPYTTPTLTPTKVVEWIWL